MPGKYSNNISNTWKDLGIILYMLSMDHMPKLSISNIFNKYYLYMMYTKNLLDFFIGFLQINKNTYYIQEFEA